MLIPSLDLYIMGVKKLKPVKKILQLRFLDNFSSTVAEECDQYDCNVSYTLFSSISSRSGWTHFTENSHQSLSRRKKNLKT